MQSVLLQPWTTVSSGLSSFTQDESGWLDLACYGDIAGLWIDVSQVTGSNVQLAVQTSPTHDEAYFNPLLPSLGLSASSTPIFAKPVRTPATSPLSRWVRWQLTGAGSLWGATFRIHAVMSKEPLFVPTDIGGCTLWLRADLGTALVMSPVNAAGMAPPAVTLTGLPAPAPARPLTSTPSVEIDITTGGALGTARFTLLLGGNVVAQNVPTAASVSLGTGNLAAQFGAGTYTGGVPPNQNIYTANVNVQSWADQSGIAIPNTVSQLTAANQPGYTSSGGPNGLPNLTFASSGPQYLTGSTVPATATNCTIFTVAQWTTLGGGVFRAIYKLGVGGNGFSIIADNTPNRDISIDNVGFEIDGTATLNWEAWTLTASNAPLQALRVNGSPASISPNNNTPNAASGGHSVGAYTSPVSSAMDGSCNEILVYNRVLSAAEITRVENYIRGRTLIW